jgi:hypothetical protein
MTLGGLGGLRRDRSDEPGEARARRGLSGIPRSEPEGASGAKPVGRARSPPTLSHTSAAIDGEVDRGGVALDMAQPRETTSTAQITAIPTTPPGDRRKHATHKASKRRRSVPEYAKLLALVPDDESRSLALGRFKDSGGNRDRWAGPDWLAMASALTRVEDLWEMKYPRRDRLPLRDARRALEDATDNVGPS